MIFRIQNILVLVLVGEIFFVWFYWQQEGGVLLWWEENIFRVKMIDRMEGNLYIFTFLKKLFEILLYIRIKDLFRFFINF